MVLHFNVKGESRKAMVKAIEKEIGGKAKYLGVPSCAYEIGNFTVGKNGELEFGDFDDLDEVAPIVDACVLATGVSPAEWENNATEEENADTEATEGEDEQTCDGVSISVPRDGFTDEALENLHKLVESKAPLMKKAFLTDDLPIIEEETSMHSIPMVIKELPVVLEIFRKSEMENPWEVVVLQRMILPQKMTMIFCLNLK